MTDRIRVLLVDDHNAFADSLQEVLGRRANVEVIGTAGTVRDAVAAAESLRPQVVLMDQRLPDGSGAVAARRILDAGSATAVVMLTGGGNEDEMLDAVEAGACGYLLKTARVGEIADAIERAAGGEMLIPADTLHDLLQHARARARDHAERAELSRSLTPREREVLRGMSTGKDTQGIADALGLSRQTVRGYVQAVIEKMGAHSRLEAVLRAQELGLLD